MKQSSLFLGEFHLQPNKTQHKLYYIQILILPAALCAMGFNSASWLQRLHTNLWIELAEKLHETEGGES